MDGDDSAAGVGPWARIRGAAMVGSGSSAATVGTRVGGSTAGASEPPKVPAIPGVNRVMATPITRPSSTGAADISLSALPYFMASPATLRFRRTWPTTGVNPSLAPIGVN